MLLTVIDLIESSDIKDGWVKYNVRLVSRCRDYWALVLERQRTHPEIPMPWVATRTRFGNASPPMVSHLSPRRPPGSVLCSLDPDLSACLQDAGFRRQARETLVTLYFSPKEQVMLCARLDTETTSIVEAAQNMKLLYVGMTRAKERLLITASGRNEFTERLGAMTDKICAVA
jgi:hypothetical protein